MDRQDLCLCSSGLSYTECCGLFHADKKHAPTAEALMRSRFSAFALQNEGYLLDTWDATKRPPKVDFSKNAADWTRLEIVGTKKGRLIDIKGIVEFKAYYMLNDEEHVMKEISRFRKIDGRWYYLDGAVKSIAKVGQKHSIGRNARCACGSGKKYKRCCGRDRQESS